MGIIKIYYFEYFENVNKNVSPQYVNEFKYLNHYRHHMRTRILTQLKIYHKIPVNLTNKIVEIKLIMKLK